MLRNILLGVAVFAAVLSVLIFSGRLPIGKRSSSGPTGTVLMWGTLPSGQMENVLQSANKASKTYRIDYQEVTEDTFSSKLLNALASGTGPDLILVPYQLILENRDRIYPFPASSLSVSQFRNMYTDGTAILYQENGALALPVAIDPLVMFSNRRLLSKHGVINPPSTWDELTNSIPKLTVSDTNGRFLESGVALGTYTNIPSAKDILFTLIQQLSQIPVQRTFVEGKENFTILADTPITNDSEVRPLSSSLRFFTQFADQTKNTYTWNNIQPDAITQFTAEKLALYIGYLSDSFIIQSKNNRIDLGVSLLPQAKGYTTSLTGMKMYAIATLKRTTNPTASLTAEGALAGATFGPIIASITHGITPIKNVLAGDTSLPSEVIQSALIARAWYDIHTASSANYIQAMILDVTSGRSGVVEAADLFVSRMVDLYTK